MSPRPEKPSRLELTIVILVYLSVTIGAGEMMDWRPEYIAPSIAIGLAAALAFGAACRAGRS